ncbi:MAG: HlyD family secretion protein [Porphyromonadaceae bacterium]|nr:HlyD family secretion protein [Porphyromonadaceae bacterium]
MKPIKSVMTLVSLAIIGWGIFEGVSVFVDHSENETSDDAQIEQYISPINVRATGYIQKICFTEHQHVKKGDTLLVLDQREYALQLRLAEATLKDAIAGDTILGATISRTRYSALMVDNSVEELEIKIKQLEKDVQRYQNLVEKKAATALQLEHMQVELDATRQELASVLRQKEVANTSVEEASLRTGSMEAAREKAEATLEQARLNYSYTVVLAPCDGQVGRRAIEEGQFIQAGTVITDIIPEREKWVIANFKEKQTGNLYVGQKVSMTVDAIKGRTYEGHVTHIAGATGSKFSNVPTDNSAGNFVKIQQRVPVRIAFDGLAREDYNQMAAGMMVVVKAHK